MLFLCAGQTFRMEFLRRTGAWEDIHPWSITMSDLIYLAIAVAAFLGLVAYAGGLARL
jgi:hypothetical protein